MERVEARGRIFERNIGIFTIFLAVFLQADSYFVTPGGSGTACSINAPCRLTTALSNASDGDLILLAKGVYTGTGDNVILLNKSVSLRGGWNGVSPPAIDPQMFITTIDGEGVRRGIKVIGDGVTLTLEGMHIINGNATGIGDCTMNDITYDVGGGIFVEDANVTIRNCVIEHNSINSDDVSHGGGIFFHNSDGQIDSNIIRFNSAGAGGGISLIYSSANVLKNKITDNNATISNGGGLYCYMDSNIVRENIIKDNNASLVGGGVASLTSGSVLQNNLILRNYAQDDGGGIYMIHNHEYHSNNIIAQNSTDGNCGGISVGCPHGVLLHTTIVDNGGCGVYINNLNESSCTLTLINTIFSGQTVGIQVSDRSHAYLENTLFWNTFYPIAITGNGTVDTGNITITGNPAFKDPANGDYHITGFSAAIDAGIDANVTEDIDGDARPIGNRYDIGADETPRSSLSPVYYLLF